MAKEVSFDLDKYNEPKILNNKDSIVQTIMMALFMKPGNLPCLPNVGVDISKYLYKAADEFNEDKLISDLEFSCGTLLNDGVYINNVRFKTVETPNGSVFILAMNVAGVDEESDTLLIGLQKKDEAVSFNYEFTKLQNN